MVKRGLGMTLEEAQTKLATLGQLETAVSQGTDLQKQVQDLTTQVAAERGEKDAALAQTKKVRRRHSDEKLQSTIRLSAMQSGVTQTNLDFAIFKYRQAVQTALRAKTAIPKSGAFFVEMKKEHAHLFGPAQPVVAAPATAPPAGGVPGAAPATTPPPPAGTPTPGETNAENMTDAEFRAHQKDKYGFAAGA